MSKTIREHRYQERIAELETEVERLRDVAKMRRTLLDVAERDVERLRKDNAEITVAAKSQRQRAETAESRCREAVRERDEARAEALQRLAILTRSENEKDRMVRGMNRVDDENSALRAALARVVGAWRKPADAFDRDMAVQLAIDDAAKLTKEGDTS